MKAKLFKLAFAFLFCFGCASLSAQSIIKANPLGLAFGVLNASYENLPVTIPPLHSGLISTVGV